MNFRPKYNRNNSNSKHRTGMPVRFSRCGLDPESHCGLDPRSELSSLGLSQPQLCLRLNNGAPSPLAEEKYNGPARPQFFFCFCVIADWIRNRRISRNDLNMISRYRNSGVLYVLPIRMHSPTKEL